MVPRDWRAAPASQLCNDRSEQGDKQAYVSAAEPQPPGERPFQRVDQHFGYRLFPEPGRRMAFPTIAFLVRRRFSPVFGGFDRGGTGAAPALLSIEGFEDQPTSSFVLGKDEAPAGVRFALPEPGVAIHPPPCGIQGQQYLIRPLACIGDALGWGRSGRSGDVAFDDRDKDTSRVGVAFKAVATTQWWHRLG